MSGTAIECGACAGGGRGNPPVGSVPHGSTLYGSTLYGGAPHGSAASVRRVLHAAQGNRI